MKEQWFALRHRLLSRGLMPGAGDSLSLRVAGCAQMWWGLAGDAQPLCMALASVKGVSASAADAACATPGSDESTAVRAETLQSQVHQAVYAARDDVCAMLWGGAAFGRLLPSFGGTMPAVFDEQVRQLGMMGSGSDDLIGLRRALASGANAAVFQNQVLLLGMTPSRLALNAELFEKCAKAYVCAVGAGGTPRQLPWIVRRVANGRLVKEQAAARAMVRAGTMPVETRGY
ncbi:hypothetical protein [Roseateles terrae]|uniref:Uncharacterized protein n=1 Tax=Roseateles terrae TaxID=431060 RepID=A0ABR6GLX7_9BURK|nr:hypothetical protein [Roseateles terrae]MBB3193072.1 hypothetical protein [Roseateles terrae]OWQ89691.1 hypothetical protein CDN98_04015 [Roseateles terrae]